MFQLPFNTKQRLDRAGRTQINELSGTTQLCGWFRLIWDHVEYDHPIVGGLRTPESTETNMILNN